MLHIISNKIKYGFDTCCPYLGRQDSLLFIAEGTYLLAQKFFPVLENSVYALEEDVVARGIKDRVPGFIQLIDYAGFVKLTERYPKIQTW